MQIGCSSELRQCKFSKLRALCWGQANAHETAANGTATIDKQQQLHDKQMNTRTRLEIDGASEVVSESESVRTYVNDAASLVLSTDSRRTATPPAQRTNKPISSATGRLMGRTERAEVR